MPFESVWSHVVFLFKLLVWFDFLLLLLLLLWESTSFKEMITISFVSCAIIYCFSKCSPWVVCVFFSWRAHHACWVTGPLCDSNLSLSTRVTRRASSVSQSSGSHIGEPLACVSIILSPVRYMAQSLEQICGEKTIQVEWQIHVNNFSRFPWWSRRICCIVLLMFSGES